MSMKSTKRKTSKGSFCPEHVFILQGKGVYIRMAVDDITFLRAARDYCEIHIKGQDPILVSVPMIVYIIAFRQISSLGLVVQSY